MSSLFDNARALVRASIADCFGSPQQVFASDGSPIEVTGYVKKQQEGDHIVRRLLTHQTLSQDCSMQYEGKTYALVYEAPLEKQSKSSQITNEYTLVTSVKGSSNGYSEFD
ncbi:hypothetical protein ABF162_08300 [Vibrio coralliilyticus]|uniref:hypothetical protein n=1 Tax=Vibrio coralliilyticus TaxID=190893 RepID=UPI0005127489|nr:hypothetical protein [Vibrio coralliilyticus]AIU67000.1 hypothetical protein JV59_32285 [Vibrio coralliilyticus]